MKKILLIVLPILVLVGAFVGLAMAGIIKIPGLTPKKKSPPNLYAQAKESDGSQTEVASPPAKQETKKPQTAKVASNEPERDPSKGAKKLAQLWNNVSTPKLVELTKGFKDNELAVILNNMDPEKVAELLGQLDSTRSARLSRELQKVASIVPKSSS